jgi:hypothetical protein
MPRAQKLDVLTRALRVYRDLFDVVAVGAHADAIERSGATRSVAFTH